MENNSILRKIFSFCAILAVVGGAIIFFIYVVALVIGGDSGESLAVMNKDTIMPIFIRIAAISVLVGLVDSYVHNTHAFSINDD